MFYHYLGRLSCSNLVQINEHETYKFNSEHVKLEILQWNKFAYNSKLNRSPTFLNNMKYCLPHCI